MPKSILIIVCLFLASTLMGQDILISDKISIRDDYAFYLLGKQNDQYLLFRDKGNDFVVQAFNANLNKAWSKKVDLDGRRTEVIDAFGGQEGFYVLYQYRKKGNTFLKLHHYDAASELVDSVLIKNYGARFNTPFPFVQYSPNRTKMLIYHVENDKMMQAIAFDIKQMKTIWETSFKLHEDLSRKYLFQPILTNSGTAFFSYEINNRKSKLKNHQFIVHVENAGEGIKLTIPVPQFLVVDYQFVYDPIHQQLIAVGLYADKSITRANGVFKFALSIDRKKAGNIQKIPFDQHLIASLAGKTTKKSLRGAEDLQISHAIVRSDGGVLLLMEKVKIFHRSSIEMPGQYRRTNLSRMSTDYYFEDVFALSISPFGAPDWKAMLYKQQTSQNDQGIFSSYFLWQNKSSIRLIFNDDIKRRTNVVEYILQANGESKRYSLFNTANEDLLLRMRDGLQISANEVIIPSQFKKKLRLVVVRY